MKKLLFIAAVAALALVSCQQEKETHGGSIAGENEIAFALRSVATRSADSAPVTEGQSISLGRFDGVELFLEETVTDLNYAAETRGTPVYTENAGYLYAGKLGVYTDAAGGVEASYALLENGPRADGSGWLYQHRYSQDIWPDETTEVQFYHRMPSDMTSHGVNSLSNAGGATTVSYTSPATAVEQQDIVFGGIKLNHKAYLGYYSTVGGAPVVLYHALTGVKFAIANDAAELAGITIKHITFVGLKNTGTFTFDTATNTFDWGTTPSATSADNRIYQKFEPTDLVNYDADTHAGNNFADSFFEAGTNQNLNDAQASKTFWLIPQSIANSDAKMVIEYKMNGTDGMMEIRLGDLKAANWEAGQIRTYTFKITEVNLKIEDEVTLAGDEDDGYEGSVKDGVTITNTGNTRAFIRASLVGQWVQDVPGPNGTVIPNLIFGFTDKVNKLYTVESWYQDQFVNTRPGVHGTFVGLPGYKGGDNPLNNWTLCTDGYYYYTVAVEPDAETAALFDTYTVGDMPMPEIGGAEVEHANMHFELEIATQAIAANKLDGTPDTWDNAWEKALGAKPVQK